MSPRITGLSVRRSEDSARLARSGSRVSAEAGGGLRAPREQPPFPACSPPLLPRLSCGAGGGAGSTRRGGRQGRTRLGGTAGTRELPSRAGVQGQSRRQRKPANPGLAALCFGGPCRDHVACSVSRCSQRPSAVPRTDGRTRRASCGAPSERGPRPPANRRGAGGAASPRPRPPPRPPPGQR